MKPTISPKGYCLSTSSYFLAFLRLYVYRYLNYSHYIWTGINEVLINYDRYLALSNTTNLFNRKNSFKIITFISCFISFLLFIPNLVAYEINLVTNQTVDTYYELKTKFGNTNLYHMYILFILAASNILSNLFLIITSVKLALQAKIYSGNLTKLQNNTKKDIKRKRLEINIFKLFLTMSVIFTIVRLNDFFYSIYFNLFILKIVNDYEFLVYYANFWYVLVVLSLNTNIFILFGFNKKFRLIFLYYAKETCIANSKNF